MLHAMLFLLTYLNYQMVRPVLLSFLVTFTRLLFERRRKGYCYCFPGSVDVCSICLHVQSQLMARRANPIIFQMPESFGQITPRQWRRGGQSSRSIFRLGTIGKPCH